MSVARTTSARPVGDPRVGRGRGGRHHNDSPFALAAGVWTRDLGRAHRVASRLDAGTVWVNMYRALQFATPFGGSKLSGYGRENGLDGFAKFAPPKAVSVSASDEPVGDPFVLRA